ncbi:unnamed protein product [Mytilus edulis]|uniref:Uncharacterized protein n=1 Tax=Mytilus edulis TaxID=6550 RepID=A0A8S3TNE7_MYTED|nr:unnamed protein product [Mytilus edulis]
MILQVMVVSDKIVSYVFSTVIKVVALITLFVTICSPYPTHVRLNSNIRTLNSLTNETKAIMAENMDYRQGQLPFIPDSYKHITETNYPITCDPSYVHMAERSTCPWRFQKNVDNNRIPVEITEAVCRVRNTNACGSTTTGLQNIRNGCEKQECREVKYYTKVLRRYSADIDEYREVFEPISAGCTCMCSELKHIPDTGRNSMCH